MNIAVMGYGVVGSGVAEVLKKNHASIVKNSRQESLELTRILDLRDFPGDPYENLVVHDVEGCTYIGNSTLELSSTSFFC